MQVKLWYIMIISISMNVVVILIFVWLFVSLRIHNHVIIKKLRETESTFNFITKLMPDALVIIDLSGKTLYWSKSAEKMFGYSQGEILYKYFDEYVKLKDFSVSPGIINQVFINDKYVFGHLYEARGTKKNRVTFPAEVIFNINEEINQDSPVLIICTIRDISERKKMDENIVKLLNMAEQAADIIFLTDIEGNIEYANKAFERITGFSKDEAIGEKPRILKSGLMEESYYKRLWDTILSGEIINEEVINKKKDGTIFYYSQAITPIFDNEGKIINFVSTGKDITSFKETQKALQTSENTLRLFVKHAPASVAMFDKEMKYLVVSDRWFEDYGIENVDIIGKCHYDIFPEIKNIPLWLEIHQRCLNGETIKNEEDKFIRKDGKIDWLRWEIHPWYSEGEIAGIIMFTEVITERKEAEIKLNNEKEKARLYLDIAGTILIVINKSGYIEMVNKKGLELLEFNESDLNGKYLIDMITLPEKKEKYISLLNEAINGNFAKFTYFEDDFMTKSKKKLLIGWHNEVIKDNEGNIIGFLCSGVDLTEQKKIEENVKRLNEELEKRVENRTRELTIVYEELKESEERLEMAFEGGGFAWWDWDYSTGKVICHPLKWRILGYEDADVVNHVDWWISIIHPDDYERTMETMKAHLENRKKIYDIIYRLKMKNGNYKWVHDKGKIIERDNNGKPKRLLGTVQDISKIKKAEEDIRKAKIIAESANKAKSIFLANMSHEIRTPLNAINGFTQLLLNDSELNAEHLKKLQIINNSGRHLLSLINDVLELSKIEAGKISLSLISFDFYELIKDIENMFTVHVTDKQIYLVFNVVREIPEVIRGDIKKIRQIFINLLGNAVKFTETGGITVNIDFEELSNNQIRLIVDVIDTGIGIPAKDIEKIFEQFQQASDISAMQAGTGLGLAITKKFISLMNGDIMVKSEPLEGSVFHFYITVEKVLNNDDFYSSINQERKKIIGIKDQTKQITILAADDNKVNRLLLINILQDVGFNVIEAVNGNDVINIMKENNSLDLILMDLSMPEVDGFEAIKYIRENLKNQKIPIIAVTASVYEEIQIKAKKIGANSLIRKPYNINELLFKIKKYIDIEYKYEKNDNLDNTKDTVVEIKEIEKHYKDIPENIKNKLIEAVRKGDVNNIYQILDNQDIDKDVKKSIINYANNFSYERLIELLKS